LQSFVGDGVRPVLRRKIKSNRIGPSSARRLTGSAMVAHLAGFLFGERLRAVWALQTISLYFEAPA